MLLEECKCVAKEKKMPEYIADNLEISSDKENSDEESSETENCYEEIFSED